MIARKITLFIGMMLCLQFGQLAGQGFEASVVEEPSDQVFIELGERFVEMMNAKTDQAAMPLARGVFVASSADEWAISFRKEYGSVNLGRMRITKGTLYSTVHVIVKSEKLNDWRNFQLVFENKPPYKCGRVNSVLAAPPLDLPKGRLSDSNVVEELGQYIDELALNQRLSGSFLIAKGDEVLIQKHAGLANRETGRAITSETPIGLASSSKMFTAVAILKLVEDKKMSLSDPLIKFIPNYPDQAFAKKLTVANLLSHTSGIPDFWDDEYERHWEKINTLEQYLPFIISKPRTTENPGGEGTYSNSNFILLGIIIEKVSGEDYYTHIQRTIFDPLEMTHTGFYKKHQDDLIAVGYLDLGKEDAIRTRGGLMGSSAGGAMSTTADMMKFKSALINNELLGKKMLQLATTKQSLLDGNGVYGYGFEVEDGTDGFGHGGQGPGSGVVFKTRRASGYTVILLSNKLNGAFSELSFSIQELLRR